MTTHHVLKQMVAAALLSDGVAMASLGLAAGTAHAENWCSPAAMVNKCAMGQINGVRAIRSST